MERLWIVKLVLLQWANQDAVMIPMEFHHQFAQFSEEPFAVETTTSLYFDLKSLMDLTLISPPLYEL